MADTMQFDLVSPERKLASVQASEVQIPGSEGDMTAMPDHAPTITTLRPGVLKVVGPEGTSEYAVTGGFAEIGGGSTTVLAEEAYPKNSENRSYIEARLEAARSQADMAEPEQKDVAEKFVADLAHLLEAME